MSDPRWVRHYPEGVPANVPPPEFATLAQMVWTAATTHRARTAFSICLPNGDTASLTFEEVDRFSDAFSLYLRETAGLAAGDRVAIQSPNTLAYPIVAFGVFKAGCILVNTNPLYTVPEMIHQFSDSGARILVISDLVAAKLPAVLPQTKIERSLTTGVRDFFPGEKPSEFVAALNAAPTGDAHTYGDSIKPDDVVALQYTGGTTGVSKGAMLTNANLLWHDIIVRKFSLSDGPPEKEIVLTPLPLYHIFAFGSNLISYFAGGSENVIIPSPKPLANLKPAFEKFRITKMIGVNTLYAGLVKEPWFRASPPRHLWLSVGGGAAMHKSVMEDWEQLVGSPIYEGYGLTETSPTVTWNPVGAPPRIGTIGIPIPNMLVKLVKDDGTEATGDEAGEILVKGPLVMAGYWNQPDETAKVLSDGWLKTGDIATMDADGYLRIVDRKKDMILVSGFNVYPNEIENCIAAIPGVVEVAVIGLPYDPTGEMVKAFVVAGDPALRAETIRNLCRESLTAYKIPREVEFRTELPKSTVGKILRRELRAQEVAKTSGGA